MDPQELVPLEAGITINPSRQHRTCNIASRSCYRAPLRICRLLILLIGLPTVFIMVPLYMRYRVFLGQMYPMSMTDMRLIDSKISTTWCQRQVVRSNATFNAFVVPGQPAMSQELVPVSMTRELELEDDMKEYWGFYLLKGSSVTVSACVKYPGASLIMIKGYKHLQECAYIGDDSSEELDEILEAYQLGLISNTTLAEKIQELKKVDGKANDPDTMRRQKPGVSFHDPNIVSNVTSSENMPNADVTDHDPNELREILERLHALRQAMKTESLKYYKPPAHLMSLPALHRHRDTNVDRDERRWLSFKDIDGYNSEVSKETERRINEIFPSQDKATTTTETNNKLTTTDSSTNINKIDDNSKLDINNNKVSEIINENLEHNSSEINVDIKKTTKSNVISKNKIDEDKELKLKVKENKYEITTEGNVNQDVVENSINEDYLETMSTPEQDSKEVFEDVLKRLQALGDRGKRVLLKLHETMGVQYKEEESTKTDIMSAVRGSDEELDRLRKVLVEAIDEEKTKTQRKQKRKEAAEEARAKRELLLGQIELTKQLNEDDEARDYAAEEGLEPDGYAEHHSTVNETTALDMSNSEFWSSFSSSEEALLECDGLILNLPLTPHSGCSADATEEESFAAAKANALTYRVPANGYYFFIFNSENEVQVNFIRARFDLQKTRYEVARTKLRECTNSTDRCDLPLDIFSSQKVVLEVPLRDNDSLWNEQFVIISECEPRTSIYLFFVIAVPILILVFAFQ